MGRAETRTQLPLDEFARVMGINPAHFNGGTAVNVSGQVWPVTDKCSDVFPQHSWQHNDRVGREELAIEIAAAEKEIEAYIGYPVSPRWVKKEQRMTDRPFYREKYGVGLDVRRQGKAYSLKAGKLIDFGKRAVTLIDAASGAEVVYSDPDGDGFFELCTITVTTTVTDANEIKLYFTGKTANPAWEIRPLKSVVITAGTVVITLDSWKLIDQDLVEAFPTEAGFSAVDISTTANFVTTVDVYREYIDNSVAPVTFYWEDPCLNCSGSGCSACNTTNQSGCAILRDHELGLASMHAATWDATNSKWVTAAWSGGREPDRFEVWYRAGEKSDAYLDGYVFEPMPVQAARMIAWLTVARLERDLCNCSNVSNLTTWLRTDATQINPPPNFFTAEKNAINPFGTRFGEIYAWRYFSRLVDRKVSVATI